MRRKRVDCKEWVGNNDWAGEVDPVGGNQVCKDSRVDEVRTVRMIGLSTTMWTTTATKFWEHS